VKGIWRLEKEREKLNREKKIKRQKEGNIVEDKERRKERKNERPKRKLKDEKD
jgi:hypothetical protein